MRHSRTSTLPSDPQGAGLQFLSVSDKPLEEWVVIWLVPAALTGLFATRRIDKRKMTLEGGLDPFQGKSAHQQLVAAQVGPWSIRNPHLVGS